MKVLSLFVGMLGCFLLLAGLITLFWKDRMLEAGARAQEILPNAQDPMLVLGVGFTGIGVILLMAAVALWTAPA